MEYLNLPPAFVLINVPAYFGGWVNSRYRALARRIEDELYILTGRHDPGKYVRVFTQTSADVACEDGIAGAVSGRFEGRKFFVEESRLDVDTTSLDELLLLTRDPDAIPIFISQHSWNFATKLNSASWKDLPPHEKNDPPEFDGMGQALIVVPTLKACKLLRYA
jgi:hypothetical protein